MLGTRIGQVVATTALVLAVFGVLAAAFGTPDTGVGVDDTGAVVTRVLPGSPGWRDGIRPGQRVEEFHDSTDPGGWRLVARDGDASYATSDATQRDALRASLWLALLGTALVVVGALMLVRGIRIGIALFPIGVALATTPLVLTGVAPDLLVAGLGLAAICALVAVAAWGGKGARIPAIVALLAGGIWVVAVAVAPGLFPGADAGRMPVALVATLVVGWPAIDRRRIVGAIASPGAPSAFDIVYLPGVLALVLAAIWILDWSPLLSVAVLAGAVLVYPWSRRLAGGAFEQLVIGNVRRRAQTKAIEEERGRLAREIHDVPMQDLSAVIRRLESLPGSEAEVDALRNVMGQLRDVATSLHPPVLQDLGLAAALVDLGDALRATVPGRDIRVEVDDLSGVAGRPPEDVESAAYRVVQEAVANALKHSGGTTVSIAGSVANEVIDLAVADSGGGLDRQRAAAARRTGHFGLDSMRERASLVGGVTTIDSTPNGVVVRFTWERAS